MTNAQPNTPRNKPPKEIVLRAWVPADQWLAGRFTRVYNSTDMLNTIMQWQAEGAPVVIVTFLYDKTKIIQEESKGAS